MKIFPPDAESETLNAGALATDQVAHRERVARVAGTVAHLAGLPNPEAHAKKVTRRSSPMSSSTARACPPRSNPAATTVGHWTMTASTSPSDSSPDPRSAAPSCRARQAPRFLTCRRPSPRTCQPWPTFSADAASTPSRHLHPPADDLGACCSHSRRGVALDMSEPQPGYRPWPSNQ